MKCKSCDRQMQTQAFPEVGIEASVCDKCLNIELEVKPTASPTYRVGQVVQIDPYRTNNKAFSACFMIITGVNGWGVEGYVQSLGTRDAMGGQAIYRASWQEIHPLGEDAQAPWGAGLNFVGPI